VIAEPLYATFEPVPALRPWVESLWVQEHPPDPGSSPTTVLPSGRVDLIVSYGDPFVRLREAREEVLPQVAITGQRTEPQRVRAMGCTGLVIFVFYPWAAGMLLGAGAIEAMDRVFPVAERFGCRTERRLREAVAPGRPIAHRVRDAQDRVLELLEGGAIDPLDIKSVGLIHRACGRAPVTRLAWELGVSRRQLQRRMAGVAGLAPKKLSSIVRFQQALALLRAGEAGADVAVDCGYTDQAHLIREFRTLGGITPRMLLDRLDQPIARSFNGKRGSCFHKTVYLQEAPSSSS